MIAFRESDFVWDPVKNVLNFAKHGVDFSVAMLVFRDSDRVILFDEKNSAQENRYFCFGKVGNKVLTVRFTLRNNKIRIIGAGYWRKGEQVYEEEKKKKKAG